MFFQNSVILQGVVSSKPKKMKTNNGETLINFKMFTKIRRNESGTCSSNPVRHEIEFSSKYPTTYEHMEKGHAVIVTGAISKESGKIIASSVNWEEGQLSDQETEEYTNTELDVNN